MRCPATLPYLLLAGYILGFAPLFAQDSTPAESLEKRHWVKEFFRHPSLSAPQLAALHRLAQARPDLAWPMGEGIQNARNAHSTNTAKDLADALKSDFTWLECDVQLEGAFKKLPFMANRRAICAHQPLETAGLLFDQWAEIVSLSGRGAKIDFKNTGAISSVLASLKKHGIPGHRLIFNFSVGSTIGVPGLKPAGAFMGVFVRQKELFQVRSQYPDAIINLGLLTPGGEDGKSYSKKQIDLLIRYAQKIKGAVMFPLRAEYVSRQVVDWLKSFGRVAIWNDPNSYVPADLAEDERKFRDWGVTGMIDLRPQKE